MEPTHSDIVERGKFDKIVLAKREGMKAFNQVMKMEYELLRLYQPEKLYIETQQEEHQTIKIDKSRINDPDYLQSLR